MNNLKTYSYIILNRMEINVPLFFTYCL